MKDAPPSAPHVGRVPSEGGTAGEEAGGPPNTHPEGEMDPKQSVLSDKSPVHLRSKSPSQDERAPTPSNAPPSAGSQGPQSTPNDGQNRHRRPTNFDEPLEQWERDEFEALLDEVKGHLGKLPFTGPKVGC